jgi:predicted acetyltransferase
VSLSPQPRAGLSETDFERVAQILIDAFNFGRDRCQAYLEQAGADTLQVDRVNGAIAGCYVSLPAGMYIGGRAVPMAGIAAVGVAPEMRSTGVASRMMRSEMQRLYAAGVPLSSLYPATIPVYRRAGYELAGVQYELRLSTTVIDMRERGSLLRRYEPRDAPGIAAVYERMAACCNGTLQRSPFFWSRVHEFRGEKTTGYVVESDGRVEGYVFYIKKTAAGGFGYSLQCTDIAAGTAAAAQRLLTFIADHRSTADAAFWYGAPFEPLALLMREQPFRPALREYWMLRVVHVPKALTARGYPRGLQAELHLDVQDDVLPGNRGKFILQVRDGRGTVTPGGRGSFKVDVRGLAPLYTGLLTPRELLARAYLQVGEDECDTAAAVFAGSTPWMRDAF